MNESSEEPAGPEGGRRLEQAATALGAAYALISLICLLWMLIPAHRKRAAAMRAAAWARRATATLAFRSGHAAMRHELASAVENYTLPYLLSLARDKAGQVYDRLRYTA